MANTPQLVKLKDYSTLKVGGRASLMVVEREEEVQVAREIAQQFPAPPLILGGGSNVLVSDAGYEGLVIKNDIGDCDFREDGDVVYVTCGAGVVFDDIVANACQRGYWGLENLSAIPGSVGATPIQNVGAYGIEVSELIHEVVAIHFQTGERRIFAATDCAFGYRDSFFKTEAGRQWCITGVTFALSMSTRPRLSYADLHPLRTVSQLSPQIVRDAMIRIRSGKFPDWRVTGTAGSFFKNPVIAESHYAQLQQQYPGLPGYPTATTQVKVSLGWILDKVCHLRGYSQGSVGLYEQQALVLVNRGGATASDVVQFAALVADQVKEKTNIDIEWEVRLV